MQYQVRAELRGKVMTWGLGICKGAEPLPAVLMFLGPAWYGARIEVTPVLPPCKAHQVRHGECPGNVYGRGGR